MLKSNDINNLPPPDTPKSTAKDKYGFNQKDIMEIIKSQTLKQTILKFQWIIKAATDNNTGALLLHTTSKLLLKKKKDNINSFGDLRGISIMPAILMVLDKLSINFIKKTSKPILKQNATWRSKRVQHKFSKIRHNVPINKK